MRHVIENDFPFEEIDQIAEIESYRKEISRPIYHIHKWWAKRLGSVFRAIISGSLSSKSWPDFYQHQSYPDAIVLDPFMGSGTTLGEATKLGARIIGCDVNPVSTFLVTQALTRIDLDNLQSEFNQIENDIRERIASFYITKIPGVSIPTPVLYYFWVKTVTTPSGEIIPLFSSYVFSKNAYPSRKPIARIWCPKCEGVFTGNYKSTCEKCSECGYVFNPQVGPVKGATVVDKKGVKYKVKDLINQTFFPPNHKLYAVMALNEAGEKVYIKPTDFDMKLVRQASVELAEIQDELPLPTLKVRSGHNTNQAKGYNYNHWRDFFNDRQLLCLGLLLQRILQIKDKKIRDHFICLFSGTLEFNNMFCSFKGEGTGAVRHMFSHHILKPERTPLENSIWGISGKGSGTFSSLFRSRLLKAKQYLDEPFEVQIQIQNGKRTTRKVICSDQIDVDVVSNWEDFTSSTNAALVMNGDSSSLPIPDSVVDAVITDPPYFDFIHYSELSDFFYAWLSPSIGNSYVYLSRDDSSHHNEVQDKDNDLFSEKIRSIFQECHRVLKDNGLMCFSYHHSTVQGWMAIYNAITQSGFDIVAAHPVKAEMSVASPKSGSKTPINLDAILVCKKESNPPKFDYPEKELLIRVERYSKRFKKLGRELGAGDRFVISCSQAIVIASCNRMKSKDASQFIQFSTTK